MLGTVFGVFIPAVLQNGFVIVGRAAVLAAGRGRRGADRRRLPRPAAAPLAATSDELTHEEEVRPCSTTDGRQRSIALTLGLSGVVAGCGDDEEEPAGGGAAADGGGDQKEYDMTLVAGVKGDEFYITMNCGAQEKAKELGVNLDFQGPDKFDATLQTPIVNAVAAKQPDAVLIAPTDTKAMFAPIKQLAAGGIEDRARRHHARQPDMAESPDRVRQRGRRPRGGQGARRADRRVGQGASSSTSSRASRPPTRARRASRRAPRSPDSSTWGRTTPRTSPRGRRRSSRRSSPRTRTSRASSRRTCSPPRARPTACARPARRAT